MYFLRDHRAALLASIEPDIAASNALKQKLLDFASNRVFKVLSNNGTPDLVVGSGVFVRISKSNNDTTSAIGTFVTAYHVLEGSTEFELRDYRNRVVAKGTANTMCYSDRAHEMAIVRVPIETGGAVEHIELQADKLVPLPILDGNPTIDPPGVAFGFAVERARPIDSSEIAFLGIKAAKDIRDLVDRAEASKVDEGGMSPGSMLFQLGVGQGTLDGMSGGLVIDHQHRFGGLVFGRSPDKYNLMIPAEIVLKRARQRREARLRGEVASIGGSPVCIAETFWKEGSRKEERDRRSG